MLFELPSYEIRQSRWIKLDRVWQESVTFDHVLLLFLITTGYSMIFCLIRVPKVYYFPLDITQWKYFLQSLWLGSSTEYRTRYSPNNDYSNNDSSNNDPSNSRFLNLPSKVLAGFSGIVESLSSDLMWKTIIRSSKSFVSLHLQILLYKGHTNEMDYGWV